MNRPQWSSRRHFIAQYRKRTGATFRAIGERFKLSAGRVRQICLTEEYRAYHQLDDAASDLADVESQLIAEQGRRRHNAQKQNQAD